MAWLRLDDKFAQHPKVVELTDRAFRVHVETMLYCAEYETHGKIPRAALKVTGAGRKTVDELAQAGLWDRHEGDRLEIHDFDIYNGDSLETRARAYLEHNPDATANEVHQAVGGNRKVLLAIIRDIKDPTGSQPVPEKPDLEPPSGSESGSESGLARAVPARTKPKNHTASLEREKHYDVNEEDKPRATDNGRYPRLEQYVRLVAWQYEPDVLNDELRSKGANDQQVAQLAAIAQQLREQASAQPAPDASDLQASEHDE